MVTIAWPAVALLVAACTALVWLWLGARRAAQRASAAQTRTEQALAALRAEHEQFVYIASHDLQEPVRAVDGFARLVVNRHAKALEPEAREFLGFVLHGAERMNAMILGLLEYSRAATTELVLGPVRIDALLSESVAMLREDSGLADCRVSSDDLPEVVADRVQLKRVFDQLLLNAVRFAKPDTEPEIRIEAEADAEAWVITFADNGIGIAPEDHSRIFEPFRRLNGRSDSSMGLGLAVCRQAITRHGGRMWVESEPGCGARFRFTLPRAERATAARAA